jgi:hypothetical protein
MCSFLFNRSASKATWSQAAEAMARAVANLEQRFDTFTTGQVGVLVRPDAEQTPVQAKAEVERALNAMDRTQFGFEVQNDETGHPWVVINDKGLEALAHDVIAVGAALVAGGMADRVMAAVYPFKWRDATAGTERPLYWIYQPRLRGYTPFVPAADAEHQERDHRLELMMEKAIRRDLPTHRQVTEWYPIWGMPV